MATQADINAHDNLITRLADELAAGLDSLLDTAVIGLASADLTDRIAINQLFADIRQFVNSQIQGLDILALDNLSLNSITASSDIESTVVTLKNATATQIDLAIDEEVNSIAGELVTAALLGLSVANIIGAIRDRIPNMVSRLRQAYDSALITFTSVLTSTLGGTDARYRYTGGVIPTTRPFCNRHDNQVYTRAEIDSIWNGTWAGKAPGDPFVVRGGYNCRHFFVLEK